MMKMKWKMKTKLKMRLKMKMKKVNGGRQGKEWKWFLVVETKK